MTHLPGREQSRYAGPSRSKIRHSIYDKEYLVLAPGSAVGGRQSQQRLLCRGLQRREVPLHDPPDAVGVHVIVLMAQHVADAADVRPRLVRRKALGMRAKFAGGFTDD